MDALLEYFDLLCYIHVPLLSKLGVLTPQPPPSTVSATVMYNYNNHGAFYFYFQYLYSNKKCTAFNIINTTNNNNLLLY